MNCHVSIASLPGGSSRSSALAVDHSSAMAGLPSAPDPATFAASVAALLNSSQADSMHIPNGPEVNFVIGSKG